MIEWQKPSAKPWLRIVAFLTALAFTCTSALWAGDPSLIPSDSPKNKFSADVLPLEIDSPKPLTDSFDLPESIGQIKNSFQGSRDRIVIHIQDAHANEEAQRNIAKILDYFAARHNLTLVNLEGAEGDLYTELFSFFPSKKARQTVADYFLGQARLTGPEYLAIVDRPAIQLHGVEDKSIYEENRKAYLDAMGFRPRDEKALGELGKVLNDLARFVFSSELRELVRRRASFQEGGRELVDYVRYLVNAAERHNIALHDYPGMHSLLALLKQEKEIDFEGAEKEIELLTSDLKKVISRERLSRFLTNTVQFRMKKMKRSDYYGYLEEVIASEAKQSDWLEKYKNVLKYLKYMRLYDSIDLKVFDEIEALEKNIKNKLFQSPGEVELDRLFRVYETYQKMFDFTLTKQDADFFYTYRDEFKIDKFKSFLAPLLTQYHFDYKIPDGLEVLDEDLGRVEQFYAAALKRDQILIQNAADKMDESGMKITALVTGGFHTPGIENYLREKDYSYLVIAPRIASAIDHEKEDRLYQDAISQKPLPLEKTLVEAFFPPRHGVLNDPRFQLAAPPLVPSRSEARAIFSDPRFQNRLDPLSFPPLAVVVSVLDGSDIDSIITEIPGDMSDIFGPYFSSFHSGVLRRSESRSKLPIELFYLPDPFGTFTIYSRFPTAGWSEVKAMINKRGLQRSEIRLSDDLSLAVVPTVPRYLIPDDVLAEIDSKKRSESRVFAPAVVEETIAGTRIRMGSIPKKLDVRDIYSEFQTFGEWKKLEPDEKNAVIDFLTLLFPQDKKKVPPYFEVEKGRPEINYDVQVLSFLSARIKEGQLGIDLDVFAKMIEEEFVVTKQFVGSSGNLIFNNINYDVETSEGLEEITELKRLLDGLPQALREIPRIQKAIETAEKQKAYFERGKAEAEAALERIKRNKARRIEAKKRRAFLKMKQMQAEERMRKEAAQARAEKAAKIREERKARLGAATMPAEPSVPAVSPPALPAVIKTPPEATPQDRAVEGLRVLTEATLRGLHQLWKEVQALSLRDRLETQKARAENLWTRFNQIRASYFERFRSLVNTSEIQKITAETNALMHKLTSGIAFKIGEVTDDIDRAIESWQKPKGPTLGDRLYDGVSAILNWSRSRLSRVLVASSAGLVGLGNYFIRSFQLPAFSIPELSSVSKLWDAIRPQGKPKAGRLKRERLSRHKTDLEILEPRTPMDASGILQESDLLHYDQGETPVLIASAVLGIETKTQISESIPAGRTQAPSNPDFAFREASETVAGTNVALYVRDIASGREVLVSRGSAVRHDPILYDVSPDGRVVVAAYHEGGPVVGQLSGFDVHAVDELFSGDQIPISHSGPANVKSIRFENGNLIVDATVRGPLYDQNGTDTREETFTFSIDALLEGPVVFPDPDFLLRETKAVPGSGLEDVQEAIANASTPEEAGRLTGFAISFGSHIFIDERLEGPAGETLQFHAAGDPSQYSEFIAMLNTTSEDALITAAFITGEGLVTNGGTAIIQEPFITGNALRSGIVTGEVLFRVTTDRNGVLIWRGDVDGDGVADRNPQAVDISALTAGLRGLNTLDSSAVFFANFQAGNIDPNTHPKLSVIDVDRFSKSPAGEVPGRFNFAGLNVEITTLGLVSPFRLDMTIKNWAKYASAYDSDPRFEPLFKWVTLETDQFPFQISAGGLTPEQIKAFKDLTSGGAFFLEAQRIKDRLAIEMEGHGAGIPPFIPIGIGGVSPGNSDPVLVFPPTAPGEGVYKRRFDSKSGGKTIFAEELSDDGAIMAQLVLEHDTGKIILRILTKAEGEKAKERFVHAVSGSKEDIEHIDFQKAGAVDRKGDILVIQLETKEGPTTVYFNLKTGREIDETEARPIMDAAIVETPEVFDQASTEFLIDEAILDEITGAVSKGAEPVTELDEFWNAVGEGVVTLLPLGIVFGARIKEDERKKRSEARREGELHRREFLRRAGLVTGGALAASGLGAGSILAQVIDEAARGSNILSLEEYHRRARPALDPIDGVRFQGKAVASREIDFPGYEPVVEPFDKTERGTLIEFSKEFFGEQLGLDLSEETGLTAEFLTARILIPWMTLFGMKGDTAREKLFRDSLKEAADHALRELPGFNIQNDKEIPSLWRGFTNVLDLDGWIFLNRSWKKVPNLNLNTFMGIVLFQAMVNYDYSMAEIMEKKYGVKPGFTFDRKLTRSHFHPNMFYKYLKQSLNRGVWNHARIRLVQNFEETISTRYMAIFFQFPDKTRDYVIQARIDQISELLVRIFPELRGFKQGSTELVNAMQIANAAFASVISTRAYWPRARKSGEALTIDSITMDDILDIANYRKVFDAAEILHLRGSIDRLHAAREDPVMTKIRQLFRDKKLSLVLKRNGPVWLRTLAEEAAKIDQSKLAPDDIRLLNSLRLLAGLQQSEFGRQEYEKAVTRELVRAAVGVPVGRLLFWVQYGFETGLISRDDTTQNIAGLVEKIERMEAILPYAELFAGEEPGTFNLNDPANMGFLSGMEKAVSVLGYDPNEWNFILYLGSRDEIARLLARFLSTLTGDEKWAREGFNFRETYTGSQQVGFVIGLILDWISTDWQQSPAQVIVAIDIINEVGIVAVLRESNQIRQQIGRAVGVKFKPIQGNFLNLEPEEQGWVMAVLRDGVKYGWSPTISKYRGIAQLLHDHREAVLEITNKWNMATDPGSPPITLPTIQQNTRLVRKVTGILTNAVDKGVVTPDGRVIEERLQEWLRNQEKLIRVLTRTRSEARPSQKRSEAREVKIRRRTFLKAGATAAIATWVGLGSKARGETPPLEKRADIVSDNLDDFLENLVKDNRHKGASIAERFAAWIEEHEDDERAIRAVLDLIEEEGKRLKRAEEEKPVQPPVEFKPPQLRGAKTTAVPENAREILVTEAQQLLDFQFRGKSPFSIAKGLASPLESSRNKANSLLQGWAEFRILYEEHSGISWHATEGLADGIISTLTEISQSQFSGTFFTAMRELYLLSSASRAKPEEIATLKTLDDFRENELAWNFLTSFTAWLVLDFRKGFDRAIKENIPSPAKYAYHVRNFAFIVRKLSAKVKTYYTNANLKGVPLDPVDTDRVLQNRAWGHYSSVTRTIEDIAQKFSVGGKEIEDILNGLILVQEAAQEEIVVDGEKGPRWKQLDEGETIYYYRLFYQTDREHADYPFSEVKNEAGKKLTLQEFFDFARYLLQVRLKSAYGDRSVLEEPGLVEELRGYLEKPETRPDWLPKEDIVGNGTDDLFSNNGFVLHRFGLIDLIEGNPRKNIPEGLSKKRVIPGEAIRAVIQHLNQLRKKKMAWPGLPTAKKELLIRERLEMFLQAVYMLHHRNGQGEPLVLEAADMSHWREQIEKGKAARDHIAASFRYDGRFIALEKETVHGRQSRFTNEKEKTAALQAALPLKDVRRDQHLGKLYDKLGIGERLEIELFNALAERFGRSGLMRLNKTVGYDVPHEFARVLASRFPIMDSWSRLGFGERLGFIVRMQQLGLGDRWLEDWFRDGLEIQLSEMLYPGIFMDTNILTSSVRRFRREDKPLMARGQEYYFGKMRDNFKNGVAQGDPTFGNRGAEGNELRRYLWSSRGVRDEAPTEKDRADDLEEGLAQWHRLERSPHYHHRPIGEIVADQREMMGRIHMAERTLVDFIGKRIYQADPDKPLWEILAQLRRQVRSLLTTPLPGKSPNRPLIDLLGGFQDRIHTISRLRQERDRQTLVTRPILDELDGLREGRKGTLLAGETDVSVKEKMKDMFKKYAGRKDEVLTNDEVNHIPSRMRQLGMSLEEAFLLEVVLTKEVEKIYRRVFGIGERELRSEEKSFVGGLALQIFLDWGVTRTEDKLKILEGLKVEVKPRVGESRQEAIDREFWGLINPAFNRLERVLARTKALQESYDQLGKQLSLLEANLKADNSYNGGVRQGELETSLYLAGELKKIVDQISLNGKSAGVLSIEDAMYLLDSWLKIGLAEEAVAPEWTEGEIDALVEHELDRLSQIAQTAGAKASVSKHLSRLGADQLFHKGSRLRSRLKKELLAGSVNPLELKILVDKTISEYERISQITAAGLLERMTDPTESGRGINPVSHLDLLLYFDYVVQPLRRINLLDFIKREAGLPLEQDAFSMTGDDVLWANSVEEPINAAFRKQIADKLRRFEAQRKRTTLFERITESVNQVVIEVGKAANWRDIGIVSGFFVAYKTLFRNYVFRESITEAFKHTFQSRQAWEFLAAIILGTFIIPQLIFWIQFSPVIVFLIGVAWFLMHLSYNLYMDHAQRTAPYLAPGETLKGHFAIFRTEQAIMAGGALFLTLWYIGAMNPYALWSVVGVMAALITYDLLKVIVEVGVTKWLGDLLFGTRRPGRVRPGETAEMQKERIKQHMTETGRVMRIIMPFYVDAPNEPEKEDAELKSAIDRLTRSLEGNNHSNVIGVFLLNTPRINDPEFLRRVARIANDVLRTKGIDPKRFAIPLRSGVVKPHNYQLFLWWARFGENRFNPQTQPPWMKAFVDPPSDRFFNGYLDLDTAAIRDFEDIGEDPNHPIRKVRSIRGVRHKNVITDADNFLGPDSAWPIMDAMIENEPQIDPTNGRVTNSAPLFIQPAVNYHNVHDTLWAYAHDGAQFRLWHFQRFLNLSLFGIRGFGKFVFDDSYVDVMMKPYPNAGFPEGRYVEIIRRTQLWEHMFEDLRNYLDSLEQRLGEGELSNQERTNLIKLGRLWNIEDIERKLRDGSLSADEKLKLLNGYAAQEIRRLVTFLKSEDEVHTNAVNQAGSHVALLDDGPGPKWGAIAAILTGLLPFIFSFFIIQGGIVPILLFSGLWGAAAFGILFALLSINKLIHKESIPMPDSRRLAAIASIAGVSLFAHLVLGLFLSGGILILFSLIFALASAVIVNWKVPHIKGAVIYEGFPSDVIEEEERELKWIGTFDVPNAWARAQEVIGADVASSYFNDLVDRGIWSVESGSAEQKWRLLLVITTVSVLTSGILEVFLPFAAEINFISIMILLLHMLITVPWTHFFDEVGRIEPVEGFGALAKNIGRAFVKLIDRLLIQALEWLLSALIYINKLFIKDPVLVKSLVGLRAQLAGGDNPWKAAAQIFTVRVFSAYLNLLAAPFSFGFNVLAIFISSASGIAGTAMALWLVSPFVGSVMLAVAFITWNYRHRNAVLEILKDTRINEAQRRTKLYPLQRKIEQLPFRLATAALVTTALYMVAHYQPLLTALSFLGAILVATLNYVYNWTSYAPRIVRNKGLTDIRSHAAKMDIERIAAEELIGAVAFVMHFVPFALSLTFLLFAPPIAAIIDWDWVLRAMPLMMTFTLGAFAAYVASFRFFPDTEEGNRKNRIAILITARVISIASVANAFLISQLPISGYLRNWPIFLYGPSGDGSLGVYSHILRVYDSFAFISYYMTGGGVVLILAALILGAWRWISLMLPRHFPLRLVQPGEERGWPEGDQLAKHEREIQNRKHGILAFLASFGLTVGIVASYVFLRPARPQVQEEPPQAPAVEKIDPLSRSEMRAGLLTKVSKAVKAFGYGSVIGLALIGQYEPAFSQPAVTTKPGVEAVQKIELPAYRFAPKYSAKELLESKEKRDEYARQVAYWEGQFHQPNVAYNSETGLTYDGYSIDPQTGELSGIPRNWSAASKEAIHINLLAMAVAGNPYAKIFVSPDRPEKAEEKAVQILTRKITSYAQFYKEFPGYGAFLPWYKIEKRGNDPAHVIPTDDWRNRVPALDNGEMAAAELGLIHVLRMKGHEKLANAYQSHFNIMMRNAVMIFYRGDGKISAEAGIKDIYAKPTPANYSNNIEGYYLDDPYEGELMAVLMDLYGTWPNAREKELVWQRKRAKLEAVDFQTSKGLITAEEGHWTSGHEAWKWFAGFPYRDAPAAWRIFQNTQKVRTWDAAMNKIPGLFASTHDPRTVTYADGIGTPQTSRQPIKRRDIVTPYAAAPVFAAGPAGIGFVWYNLMLKGRKMQGPRGSSESIYTDGSRIAPLLTWDAKILTLVGMFGGVDEYSRKKLKADKKYDRFVSVIEREYSRAFPKPKGLDIPFALPTASLPQTAPDFKATQEVEKGAGANILERAKFEGGGELLTGYRLREGKLTLPAVAGYIFTMFNPVDLTRQPILNLTASTQAEGIVLFEVKNTDDDLVTEQKFGVRFPNTNGKPVTFSIDLAGILTAQNKTAGLIVFSDPQIEVVIQHAGFSAKPPAASESLNWDGRQFLRSQEAKPKTSQLPQAGIVDILGKVNFQPGGDIQYKHEDTLSLQQSGGWIWGRMPSTDISQNRYVVFSVRSSGAGVWMELKNAADKHLAGTEKFGIPKVYVEFPDTKGKVQTVVVDLSKQLIAGISDRKARIISFSDPEGDIEILSIQFMSEAQLKQSKLKPRSEARGLNGELKAEWRDRRSGRKTFFDDLKGIKERKIKEKKVGRFFVQHNPVRQAREKGVGRPEKDDNLVSMPFGTTTDFNQLNKQKWSRSQRLLDTKTQEGALAFNVNYAPVVPYHFLLIPTPLKQLPQFLTEWALAIALAVLELSRRMILGFNSLGAWASINHLHFQGFYARLGSLPIEQAAVVKEADLGDGVDLYRLAGYPLRGLVLKGNRRKALAKHAYRYIKLLQDQNIPHIVLLRKKTIYVIPTSRQRRADLVGGVGFMEAAGRVYVPKERYETITESEVEENLAAASLGETEFTQLLNEYLKRSETRTNVGIRNYFDDKNLHDRDRTSKFDLAMTDVFHPERASEWASRPVDEQIATSAKAARLRAAIKGATVMVGIPVYQEAQPDIEVLVSNLAAALEDKVDSGVVLLVGEPEKRTIDLLDSLEIDELGSNRIKVATFVKPLPEKDAESFKGKPWSVRALMQAALQTGGQHPHLLIVDADVRLAHGRASAKSLIDSLLNPIIDERIQAQYVTLDAPRIFRWDDGIVHLFTFLLTNAVYNVSLHHSHGGEFAMSREALRFLVSDEVNVSYDRAYEVAHAFAIRLALEGSYKIAEVIMKTKTHAPVNRRKIFSRLELVIGRLFEDAIRHRMLILEQPQLPQIKVLGDDDTRRARKRVEMDEILDPVYRKMLFREFSGRVGRHSVVYRKILGTKMTNILFNLSQNKSHDDFPFTPEQAAEATYRFMMAYGNASSQKEADTLTKAFVPIVMGMTLNYGTIVRTMNFDQARAYMDNVEGPYLKSMRERVWTALKIVKRVADRENSTVPKRTDGPKRSELRKSTAEAVDHAILEQEEETTLGVAALGAQERRFQGVKQQLIGSRASLVGEALNDRLIELLREALGARGLSESAISQDSGAFVYQWKGKDGELAIVGGMIKQLGLSAESNVKVVISIDPKLDATGQVSVDLKKAFHGNSVEVVQGSLSQAVWKVWRELDATPGRFVKLTGSSELLRDDFDGVRASVLAELLRYVPGNVLVLGDGDIGVRTRPVIQIALSELIKTWLIEAEGGHRFAIAA